MDLAIYLFWKIIKCLTRSVKKHDLLLYLVAQHVVIPKRWPPNPSETLENNI